MRKKEMLAAVMIVCTLCSCGGTKEKKMLIRSVCLTTPLARQGAEVRSYSGIIKEAHEINLGFKAAGQIERIYVKEGDYVHRGQLLAELDDVDYRLAVEAIQVQYDQMRDETGRMEQLLRQRSLPANDYEKANAGLKQLAVRLQGDKNKLKYTKLHAPVDGYVQAVNFSKAEMVDAGTAVFTLLDNSRMEVTFDIPVREHADKEDFAQYYCSLSGRCGAERIPMRFLSLTPKADGNQLYSMRLTFAELPDRLLTPGMNVTVSIVPSNDGTKNKGFTLPLHSVFEKEDAACVWVLNPDSTVTPKEVGLESIDSDGRAVISSGLTGEEKIIRAGVHSLQEGDKVHVIEQPSKTNVGGLL